MKKNDELKRYNIEPIRELTKSEIEHIATEVVKKIEPVVVDFDGNYMYEHIMNAKMYIAKIPEQYTDVNYIVFTNAIYIRNEENIKEINEIMVHEIFHYIQCNQKNNYGKMPEQMGLCKFQTYKITGLAINEAAIQLIISIVFNNKQEGKNYFGLSMKTVYDRYYPILCGLLQQITYILGYKELLKSILKNTDDFREAFEEFAGMQKYDFLREAFDKIMQSRDNIAKNKRLIQNETDVKKKKILEKEINIYIKEIQNYFSAVQELCYTKYFDPLFKKVKTKGDLEELKEEIERYREHTASIEEKDYFMIYIQKRMKKLNKKIK